MILIKLVTSKNVKALQENLKGQEEEKTTKMNLL